MMSHSKNLLKDGCCRHGGRGMGEFILFCDVYRVKAKLTCTSEITYSNVIDAVSISNQIK